MFSLNVFGWSAMNRRVYWIAVYLIAGAMAAAIVLLLAGMGN